jgi:hypothetical protein
MLKPQEAKSAPAVSTKGIEFGEAFPRGRCRFRDDYCEYPDEAVWNKPETAEFKIKVRTFDDWIRKKRIPFAKLPSGTADSGSRRF